MRQRLHGERGSVSPVFLALCWIVLLLLGAFLERDWANYTMKMAEQTADFAAEAGGRTHIDWAVLKVRGRQLYTEWVTVCDVKDEETGTCLESHQEPRTRHRYRTWTVQVNVRELLAAGDHWGRLVGCKRSQAWKPEFQCVEAVAIDRYIQFPALAEEVVRTTFAANWPNRPAAKATVTDVCLNAGTREVQVTVNLRVRSLLGLIPWEEERRVTGHAVVVLSPLPFAAEPRDEPWTPARCPRVPDGPDR